MKEQMKKLFCIKTLFALTLVLAVFIGAASVFAEPWKFGVMSDTQWTCPTDPAGQNPHGVPKSIINQINTRFINEGVKFVIQVGDLTQHGYDAYIATRAVAAQPLIDAAIGFFPMRGNHETNAKPAGSNNYGITQFRISFPQTQNGTFTKADSNTFTLGSNFNSPILAGSYIDDLKGMSYSFDYGTAGNNARFVIIDNWATSNKRVDHVGLPYGYSITDQQAWISGQLDKNTRGTEHAFVFSHQPLIAETHKDCLFHGYTNANPDMQNVFFASLQSNDVKYYISGHDHIHQRSIITSPDGASKVQELICASDSSTFYTPEELTDPKNPNWYAQKRRETSLSQEMYHIGYYIFTVDGPQVTVDYYSNDHGNLKSDSSYPKGPTGAGSQITPTFKFIKKETWGYSLNGHEFLVIQGQMYTNVVDSFGTTTARILSGINGSTARDFNNRPLTKTVNTGWSPPKADNLASNVLTLWGMADLGSNQTDVYTLSMTYDHKIGPFGNGDFGLATKDKDGKWINAVNMNLLGAKKFVLGPWDLSYGIGTYGVDPTTNTAWAVIPYNGDFAVARDIEPVPEH